jgi:hypothetical protein
MKAFDLSQVRLKKTTTVDHSAPKLKGVSPSNPPESFNFQGLTLAADVEALSADHDQVFMSFNIEHWYVVLGPKKTSATTFLPLSKSMAVALSKLHDLHLTLEEISSRIKADDDLLKTCAELQRLIHPEGSFIKTSARSCKDVALQIGLMDRYRELVSAEITKSGSAIDEMRLRSLFMEAGRQVLRFKDAHDFLVSCVLSERISGVISIPNFTKVRISNVL